MFTKINASFFCLLSKSLIIFIAIIGWRLIPIEIEFWVDGEGRIHERLNYIKKNGSWERELLYP